MLLKVRGALLASAMSVTFVVAGSAQAPVAAPAATQAPITPAKVAIINAQRAVAETQEIKKAQQALEVKYRPRQQQIETLQKDLQTIQQQLRGANLAPEREAQLNADGQRKQKQLQRLGEDLQTDFDHERQDILGKTGRQMQEVVKKMAEARGLDVVIDVTNTIYFKPALDITSEAVVAYDKAYPAQ